MYANLTEDSTAICQPANLKIELMEHQKRSIYAMNELEKTKKVKANIIYFFDEKHDLDITTNMGVLGDKVGSGKTYVVLGLITVSKEPARSEDYLSSNSYALIKLDPAETNYCKCNLIIVPPPLITQWKNSLKNTSLTYASIGKKAELVNKIYYDTDVILLSSALINDFMNMDINSKKKWARVIIDEADSIKLNLKYISTNFLWLMTGTPSGISYSTSKMIKNVFKKYITWLPDFVTIKNNNDYINDSLKLPKIQREFINCYTSLDVKLVTEFVPKHIMSMINAGNTDEAIRALNMNTYTEENIINALTKNITGAIENKTEELVTIKEQLKKHNQKYHNIEDHDTKDMMIRIAFLEKLIGKLKVRLNGIKEKIKEMKDELCAICMNELDKPSVVNCCANGFCFACIVNYVNKNGKCPLCNKKITKKNIHVTANIDKKTTEIEKRPKMVELLDLVDKYKTGKLLIFASYDKTFEKIAEEFTSKKIKYRQLKGSQENINKIVDNFKNGDLNILLLNSINFGAGMNLECASDIILYHRLTKEMEEQVIGRGQRIGRTTQLRVHYLIYEGEEQLDKACFKYEDLEDELEEDL
uniref:RING-type domain-containing protein n=1 Tax=viral metagenome TaxID=1070528 RepID=A0A6C0EB91_9ZZZZ